jgi:DNA-binding NarL/FixJ family response regulator
MTLQQIYTAATGDPAPHGKTLAAQILRESHRRQRIIAAYRSGMSLRSIGLQLEISHASVRSAIALTMHAVRKRLLGLPRYHQHGRAGELTRASAKRDN